MTFSPAVDAANCSLGEVPPIHPASRWTTCTHLAGSRADSLQVLLFGERRNAAIRLRGRICDYYSRNTMCKQYKQCIDCEGNSERERPKAFDPPYPKPRPTPDPRTPGSYPAREPHLRSNRHAVEIAKPKRKSPRRRCHRLREPVPNPRTRLPIPGAVSSPRGSRPCVLVLRWPLPLIVFSPMRASDSIHMHLRLRERTRRREEQLAIPEPDARVLVLYGFLFRHLGHWRRDCSLSFFAVRPPRAQPRREIEPRTRGGSRTGRVRLRRGGGARPGRLCGKLGRV